MQKDYQNKAIGSAENKKVESQEFYFSGDETFPPVTIKAASREEAETEYQKLHAEAGK